MFPRYRRRMSAAEPPQGLSDARHHHAASDDPSSGPHTSRDALQHTPRTASNSPRNGTVRETALSPRVMAAVFVGGMAGTALRLALNAAMDDALWMGASVPFPTATVVVNLVGSGVLGLLVGAGWNGTAPWMRPAVTSGLLGSFTTFSALIAATLPISVDPAWDADTGWGGVTGWGVAALVLVGSVAAGLIAAAAGVVAGRSLASRGARASRVTQASQPTRASRGTRRHQSASRPTAPRDESESPRGPEVIG